MNREIKFRAFDDGKMIYHDLTNPPMVSRPRELAWFFDRIRDDAVVMQYIGLSDKNGKAIYECDIVETPSVKNMVIGWSEKFASFVIHRDGWAFQHFFGEAMNPEDCTVIGNVFETPELLKQ